MRHGTTVSVCEHEECSLSRQGVILSRLIIFHIHISKRAIILVFHAVSLSGINTKHS